MLPYHSERWVALFLEAVTNTGGKSFKVSQSDISWLPLPKKQEGTLSSHHQTRRLARPEIQKTCHFWKSGECDVSLRKGFFLLSSIPLCVSPPLTDSSGWEFVLVETEYIFCLLGFTWCVLSSIPLDSTDTLRFSLAVSRWRRRATSLCAWACSLACLRACSSALHQLVYCMHIMEGVHVSACMCVNVRSFISACVWYFEVCSKGE